MTLPTNLVIAQPIFNPQMLVSPPILPALLLMCGARLPRLLPTVEIRAH